MHIVYSAVGFLIFALSLAIIFWFGAAILLFIFISSIVLGIYVAARGHYLRWRYKGINPNPPGADNVATTGKINATIIDVEYQDVSDEK